MSEKPTPDVVRWYTRARKFPQLIGRTPDGAKLWGGPYTITQAVGAGMTLFVGLNTMSLWAGFGFVGNLLVLLGVTYGVVLGLGRIPVGSRNPLSVAAGAYKALAAPAHGRVGGKPVRLRRPHRVRHTVVVRLDHPTPAPTTAAGAVPSAVLGVQATKTATATATGAGHTSAWSRRLSRQTPGRLFEQLARPAVPRRRNTRPAQPASAPALTVAPAQGPVQAPAQAPAQAPEPTTAKPALTGVQSLLAGAGHLSRSEAS